MSQSADLLALLSDGQPHEMRDIHRAIGFCRLNSRVSELRGRGHLIECDKSGGQYVYRLLSRPLAETAQEEGSLRVSVAIPSVAVSASGVMTASPPPLGTPLDSWTEPNGREGRSQTALPAPVEASPSRDRGPFVGHRSAPLRTGDAASVHPFEQLSLVAA